MLKKIIENFKSLIITTIKTIIIIVLSTTLLIGLIYFLYTVYILDAPDIS